MESEKYGVGLRVKSRGSMIKKIEFTLNYIIVGVSDFSLQKFNLSIFVTEGLLKNSLPSPFWEKSRVHPQMYHSGA